MKHTRTLQKAIAVLLTVLLALSATALGSFAADDYDLTGATRFVFSDSKITVTAGDYTGYKISGTALTINAAPTLSPAVAPTARSRSRRGRPTSCLSWTA